MKEFIVDLHVHTCLSACGMPGMIPPAIVAASKLKGLDGIGITDHNSAGNVGAVMAAGGNDLVVFGGMEITTQEEIHLLGLLGDLKQLALFQSVVSGHLHGKNDPDRFGEQYLVDEEGYVTGLCDALLSSATDMPLEDAVDLIHEFGGIAVAAHIDRESFSIVSQLGFIPESLPLDGVEIAGPGGAAIDGTGAGRFTRLASSDAHSPEQIGSAVSVVLCECLTFEELKSAIAGEGGRTIRPVWK